MRASSMHAQNVPYLSICETQHARRFSHDVAISYSGRAHEAVVQSGGGIVSNRHQAMVNCAE
jgi:hypothetical protein